MRWGFVTVLLLSLGMVRGQEGSCSSLQDVAAYTCDKIGPASLLCQRARARAQRRCQPLAKPQEDNVAHLLERLARHQQKAIEEQESMARHQRRALEEQERAAQLSRVLEQQGGGQKAGALSSQKRLVVPMPAVPAAALNLQRLLAPQGPKGEVDTTNSKDATASGKQHPRELGATLREKVNWGKARNVSVSDLLAQLTAAKSALKAEKKKVVAEKKKVVTEKKGAKKIGKAKGGGTTTSAPAAATGNSTGNAKPSNSTTSKAKPSNSTTATKAPSKSPSKAPPNTVLSFHPPFCLLPSLIGCQFSVLQP